MKIKQDWSFEVFNRLHDCNARRMYGTHVVHRDQCTGFSAKDIISNNVCTNLQLVENNNNNCFGYMEIIIYDGCGVAINRVE